MKKISFVLLMVLMFIVNGKLVSAEEVTSSNSSDVSTIMQSTEEAAEEKNANVTTQNEQVPDMLREQYESDYRKEVMTFEEYVEFIKTINRLDNSQFEIPEIGITPFSAGSERDRIVAEARKHLGKPYTQTNPARLGPNAFDCSGLAYYVFKTVTGRDIGNVTWTQEYAGSMINVSDAKPGDLIFWGTRGSTYHVAIYIGNSQYIHAPDFGKTVEISPIWWNDFPPSFAIRMDLKEEPPRKQTTIVEVNKTVMVNNEWKSIDSLPWGAKGYARVSTSTSFTGKVVSTTQENGGYAYSPELKGWIDKKGLVEVVRTNCQGTIKYGGYSIDQMPWYAGVPKLGDTTSHLNKSVTVTARNGAYYYVANLGWIDKKAFNVELQQAVDGTPNSNSTSSTKRTMTEMNTTASVIGNDKSIDSLPWGIKGYSYLGSLNSHAGKTVNITQEWGAYVYSPELKGWVDKKGLSIK